MSPYRALARPIFLLLCIVTVSATLLAQPAHTQEETPVAQQVLYRFNTGGSIGGGIVGYSIGGKQYVAVASGRASFLFGPEGAPTIFVFALPDN